MHKLQYMSQNCQLSGDWQKDDLDEGFEFCFLCFWKLKQKLLPESSVLMDYMQEKTLGKSTVQHIRTTEAGQSYVKYNMQRISYWVHSFSSCCKALNHFIMNKIMHIFRLHTQQKCEILQQKYIHKQKCNKILNLWEVVTWLI